ncbi:hypothetical protein PSAC2689_150141 [Paraburkholderia sacchari]
MSLHRFRKFRNARTFAMDKAYWDNYRSRLPARWKLQEIKFIKINEMQKLYCNVKSHSSICNSLMLRRRRFFWHTRHHSAI